MFVKRSLSSLSHHHNHHIIVIITSIAIQPLPFFPSPPLLSFYQNSTTITLLTTLPPLVPIIIPEITHWPPLIHLQNNLKINLYTLLLPYSLTLLSLSTDIWLTLLNHCWPILSNQHQSYLFRFDSRAIPVVHVVLQIAVPRTWMSRIGKRIRIRIG